LDVVMAEKGAFDETACCLAHLIRRQSAGRFAIRLRRERASEEERARAREERGERDQGVAEGN
jgi:hypothetical protein